MSFRKTDRSHLSWEPPKFRSCSSDTHKGTVAAPTEDSASDAHKALTAFSKDSYGIPEEFVWNAADNPPGVFSRPSWKPCFTFSVGFHQPCLFLMVLPQSLPHAHARPLEFSMNRHGTLPVVPCDSWWIPTEISWNSSWNARSSSMEFLTNSYGMLIKFPWNVHRTCIKLS